MHINDLPSAHNVQLDAAFSALADPTRRAIVARLASGEATVNELAAPFSLTQPTVSRHIKVLEEAGLVARRRDAQRRPCRLVAPRLAEMRQWIESYEAVLAANYARLDEVLDVMAQEKSDQRKRKGRRK